VSQGSRNWGRQIPQGQELGFHSTCQVDPLGGFKQKPTYLLQRSLWLLCEEIEVQDGRKDIMQEAR
jgi:hypothetical protein